MTAADDAVVRLAVWSGPRNISTALMRSWENRSDSIVVDEPFYGHFLSESGRIDPGRDEVLAAMEHDWRVVADQLLAPVREGVRVFYSKQMAHHLTDAMTDHDFLRGLTNVILIRDPDEVVSSYIRSRPDVTASDIGLPQQAGLYDELAAAGTAPPVIDAADFLADPRGCLGGLCRGLALTFEEGMLAWPAGRRATDGVWGTYWYDAVWASTGFEPYRPREVHLSGRAATVAAECRPAYERLHKLRWTDWQVDPWTSR